MRLLGVSKILHLRKLALYVSFRCARCHARLPTVYLSVLREVDSGTLHTSLWRSFACWGIVSVSDQAWVAQWKCDLAAFGFISSIAAAVARGLHGKSPSDRSILLSNTVTMRIIFPSIHF